MTVETGIVKQSRKICFNFSFCQETPNKEWGRTAVILPGIGSVCQMSVV